MERPPAGPQPQVSRSVRPVTGQMTVSSPTPVTPVDDVHDIPQDPRQGFGPRGQSQRCFRLLATLSTRLRACARTDDMRVRRPGPHGRSQARRRKRVSAGGRVGLLLTVHSERLARSTGTPPSHAVAEARACRTRHLRRRPERVWSRLRESAPGRRDQGQRARSGVSRKLRTWAVNRSVAVSIAACRCPGMTATR
jgi:hypothetical protein